jgi:membrane protease YdiL (CAAX protease family)
MEEIKMLKFTRAHPLLAFFVLTFLLSWAIWIPLALDHYALLPARLDEGFVMVVRLFGTLGPAVSAILVSLLLGGRPAAGALLAQIGRWRVKWTWVAAAALVFPALLFVSAWIYRLLPGAAPLPVQPLPLASLVVILLVMTVSVLGEEIGWRGFALPRMQKKWTALESSLILAAIWTAWHLPFWVVLGELERFGWGYWLLNWAFISAGSIYITWLMNNTRNSLLMALIFHWTYNVISVGYLPLTSVIPAYTILIGLIWALALGLLRLYGTRRLVRSHPAVV